MSQQKSRKSRKYSYTLTKKNTNIWPFKCSPQIPNPFHLLLFAFVIIICFVFTFTAISANEDPTTRPKMTIGSSQNYGPTVRVKPNLKMRPSIKTTTPTITPTSNATSTLLASSTIIISSHTIMSTDTSEFEMDENSSQQQSNTNIQSVSQKKSQPYTPVLSKIDQVPGYSNECLKCTRNECPYCMGHTICTISYRL